ncbi:MAG: hypothetical protein QF473_27815 [Planctomycetota bacterium]|nr:hypothetical protein [Planctomycetota bacterium]
MRNPIILPTFAFLFALALTIHPANGEPTGPSRTVSFARGKWDASKWKSIRMVNQKEARVFNQNDESLGVTKESFRKGDYNRERDNAILVNDTGLEEGEIAITFRMGDGFNKNSTPGLLVSPVIEDGVMKRGIGVFVSTYGMVVWLMEHDEKEERVTYKHLGQLTRWTDIEGKHALRFRFSKKQKILAFKIDDSGILVFRFIGNPRLSKTDLNINGIAGIWGCHGVCDFYEMKIERGGSLPFFIRTKPDKGQE